MGEGDLTLVEEALLSQMTAVTALSAQWQRLIFPQGPAGTEGFCRDKMTSDCTESVTKHDGHMLLECLLHYRLRRWAQGHAGKFPGITLHLWDLHSVALCHFRGHFLYKINVISNLRYITRVFTLQGF